MHAGQSWVKFCMSAFCMVLLYLAFNQSSEVKGHCSCQNREESMKRDEFQVCSPYTR